MRLPLRAALVLWVALGSLALASAAGAARFTWQLDLDASQIPNGISTSAALGQAWLDGEIRGQLPAATVVPEPATGLLLPAGTLLALVGGRARSRGSRRGSPACYSGSSSPLSPAVE